MKQLAFIVGVFWVCGMYTAAAKAMPKVASINLCADQLVLLLAEAEQITTLSSLSQQEAGSYYYLQARSYPTNEGRAEQILPLQPDLVIAGEYTSQHTIKVLEEVGLRVETLPIASSIETMLANITQVGLWLEQQAVAVKLVQGLKQRLVNLEARATNPPRAAVFDPNGFTVGEDTLRGKMIALAGWENAASLAGIKNYGKLSLEALISLAPDVLIESPYSPGTYSRGQALGFHPAIGQSGIDPDIITVPSRMTICAGPWTLDVIELLQTKRQDLQSSTSIH